MNVESFLQHRALHGFPWTAAHYGFRALRKVTACEILRVFVSDGSPVSDGQVDGYVTRELTPDEVQGCPLTLPQGQEFAAAMKGGARCFVSIFGHRVVGYTFYSRQSVPLRPGLSLTIPPECDYSHGSYTAPDHRGKDSLWLERIAVRSLIDKLLCIAPWHGTWRWTIGLQSRSVTGSLARESLATRPTSRWVASSLLAQALRARNSGFPWSADFGIRPSSRAFRAELQEFW